MGHELARRVRENTNTPAKSDDTTSQPPSLARQIQAMEKQFQLAMPRGAEAAQLVRDALTCLRTTRNLAKAEPTSVLGALMTCAQLGLRPGVLGHAWVLPFWDKHLVWTDEQGRERKGGHRAQLVIGYQGLIELAHRSGRIQSLVARTVYENDEFDVAYGLEDQLTHRPAMHGDRGKPIAYYAVAKFTTGGHAFYLMTHSEMETYRDLYATARNEKGEIVGPWVTNFEGMALKTTIRQLSKWMPKSTEFASAIEADGTVRVDLTPDNLDAMLHGEHRDSNTIDGEIVPDPDNDDEPEERAAPEPTPPARSVADPAITRVQLSKIRDALNKLDVTDLTDVSRTLTTLAKRKVGSASELARAEADELLATFDRCLADPDPARALDAVLAAQGGDQ